MNFLKQWAMEWVKPIFKKWIKERGMKLPGAKVDQFSHDAAKLVAKALKTSDPLVIGLVAVEVRNAILKAESEIQNAAIREVDSIRL